MMPAPLEPADDCAVRGAVFLETYGCAFNQADSEAMAGVLAAEGFTIVDAPELADVIIINSCTVKDRTYARFEHRLRELKRAAAERRGPQLVVAGCVPKTMEQRELLAGVAALGPDQVGRVAEVTELALRGEAPQVLASPRNDAQRLERPLLPTRRQHEHIEILPLASGCLSQCTFCQTRLARGRLQSFRPGDLLLRARQAAEAGVSEIWLTAQDTGAYGRDVGYRLPELLGKMCEIAGDFRIRLGMTSPCWIVEALEEYLDVFRHQKLFTCWHVPLQAGSDAVLAHMRRGNTAAEFVELARRFGQAFPDGALLTDIIVGYPTETEEDFAATLACLAAAGVAGVNRSNFSARPGTAAARLNPLAPEVIKRRMEQLTVRCAQLGRKWHTRWIGRRERVRTVEQKRAGSTIAHNQAGRPVILAGNFPMAQWVVVEYTHAADYHHRAQQSL